MLDKLKTETYKVFGFLAATIVGLALIGDMLTSGGMLTVLAMKIIAILVAIIGAIFSLEIVSDMYGDGIGAASAAVVVLIIVVLVGAL